MLNCFIPFSLRLQWIQCEYTYFRNWTNLSDWLQQTPPCSATLSFLILFSCIKVTSQSASIKRKVQTDRTDKGRCGARAGEGSSQNSPHCWCPALAVPWASGTEETKHRDGSLKISKHREFVTCELCKHCKYRAETPACHTSIVTSISSGEWQEEDDPGLVDVSSTPQPRLLPFTARNPNSKLWRKKGEESLVTFLWSLNCV